MARVPLIPLDKGPIIAPALQMASQIREGRARASITEETARTYPQERRQRLDIGAEQVRIKAEEANRAPLETEAKGYAVDKAKREKEDAPYNRDMKKVTDAYKLAGAAIPRMRDASSYNASLSSISERTGVAMEELGGLIDPDMSQEDFVKHMEATIPAFHEAKYKHELRMKEVEARGANRKAVARIYTDARKTGRDYSKLTASDRATIDKDLDRQWFEETHQEVEVETGRLDQQGNPVTQMEWRPTPNPPKNKSKWYADKFNERVSRAEGTRKGPLPKLEL